MSIMNPFGERNGKIVHIDELSFHERGLKCNCTCPNCGMKLQARLGNEIEHKRKRTKHFAHHNSNCSNSIESSIHRLAKEVFAESNIVLLPSLSVSRRVLANLKEPVYSYIDIRESHQKAYFTIPKEQYYYTNVRLESRVGPIIPDIVLSDGKNEIFIEIAVTHFVDELKSKKIFEIQKSAIEIDLKYLKTTSLFNRKKFKDELLNSLSNKRWLFNQHAEMQINADKDLYRQERERVKSEKKKREKERREKIKIRTTRENERKERIKLKKDRDNERREKERQIEISKAAKIEKFKHYRKLLTEKMVDDPLWVDISQQFGITSTSSIPIVFMKEFREEWLFDCAAPIWKMMLYHDLIEGKQGQSLTYWQIRNWVRTLHGMRFHKSVFSNRSIICNDMLNKITGVVLKFMDYLTLECNLLCRTYPYQRYDSCRYEIKHSNFHELLNMSISQIQQLTNSKDIENQSKDSVSNSEADDVFLCETQNRRVGNRESLSNNKLYNAKGYHFSNFESRGILFLSNLYFLESNRSNLDIFEALFETHPDLKIEITGYHLDCIVIKVNLKFYKIERHNEGKVIIFNQLSSVDQVYIPNKHAVEYKMLNQFLEQQINGHDL